MDVPLLREQTEKVRREYRRTNCSDLVQDLPMLTRMKVPILGVETNHGNWETSSDLDLIVLCKLR